ncbi:MAG: hypothetical protein IKQ68_04235 [Prevotella sp.]|nr:hypothetical protein [Prevotella sp.]
MKKTFLTLFTAIAATMAGFAQEAADSTSFITLNDMVKREAATKAQQENQAFHEKLWDRRSYLNISYVSATLKSSELPTVGGTYSGEYKSNGGVNLQYGHTYDFHQKPIADMVFIGLNYTGIDLSYASYSADVPSPYYQPGTNTPNNAPWHNKKQTIDYGMALGPAVTVYPFTTLGNKHTDKIRFQLYFQVGYNASLTILQDGIVEQSKNKTKDMYAFAHGLSTKFGFSLTWDFVGLGYEIWNAPSYKNIYFDDLVDTGKMKTKVKSNRVFLQFRF